MSGCGGSSGVDDSSPCSRGGPSPAVDAPPRPLTSSGAITVRHTPYTGEANARGVFAEIPIPRGTLIECAHTIRIPALEHTTHIEHTVFQHYTFNADKGDYLLALGIGSLFNHSRQPNVDYRVDKVQDVIRYFAARDIAAGEELFIFYGHKLWFEDTLLQNQPEQTQSTTREGDEHFNVDENDSELLGTLLL